MAEGHDTPEIEAYKTFGDFAIGMAKWNNGHFPDAARRLWNEVVKAREKIAELEGMLDKWPKTKDGVTLYPGIEIWPPERDADHHDDAVNWSPPGLFEPSTVMHTWCGSISSPREWSAEEGYADLDAARAAWKEQADELQS